MRKALSEVGTTPSPRGLFYKSLCEVSVSIWFVFFAGRGPLPLWRVVPGMPLVWAQILSESAPAIIALDWWSRAACFSPEGAWDFKKANGRVCGKFGGS
jgi:hypothetical protein